MNCSTLIRDAFPTDRMMWLAVRSSMLRFQSSNESLGKFSSNVSRTMSSACSSLIPLFTLTRQVAMIVLFRNFEAPGYGLQCDAI